MGGGRGDVTHENVAAVWDGGRGSSVADSSGRATHDLTVDLDHYEAVVIFSDPVGEPSVRIGARKLVGVGHVHRSEHLSPEPHKRVHIRRSCFPYDPVAHVVEGSQPMAGDRQG